jgi:hypothetical protein
LTDGDTSVVRRPAALNIANLIRETKRLLVLAHGANDRWIGGFRGTAMDVFTKLFGDFLVFVYHCFD